MMLFRSNSLHKPNPTLAELYVEDPQIFQRLLLPTGVSGLLFRSVALHELGDLETTFEDAEDFKAYMEPWSSSHLAGWNRIKTALEAEYNPIHNYNMTEKEAPAETTETVRPAETTETERPAETTETVTPAETTTSTSPAETTVTDRPPEITDSGSSNTGIYGFNSAQDAPAQANTGASETKRTVQTAGTAVTTVQTAGAAAVKVDNPETVKREVDTSGTRSTTVNAAGSRVFTVQTERTLERSGNIGVTTSQQMIEAELDLRIRTNLLAVIVSDFRRELCVGVW